MDLIILAAETVDAASLSGGAGWVGAGLLGAVLSWLLMIHLPAKDKQIATMLSDSSAERTAMMASQRSERDQMFLRFDTTLDKILLASRETTERATKEFREDSEILRVAINGLSESIKEMKA